MDGFVCGDPTEYSGMMELNGAFRCISVVSLDTAIFQKLRIILKIVVAVAFAAQSQTWLVAALKKIRNTQIEQLTQQPIYQTQMPPLASRSLDRVKEAYHSH
jgi:hypothetical protein